MSEPVGDRPTAFGRRLIASMAEAVEHAAGKQHLEVKTMIEEVTDELGNSSAPAAPASLASTNTDDLDWLEAWLIQKRSTEHAARPYGKGSLLLTTLVFEVRRERRRRQTMRGTELGDHDDLARHFNVIRRHVLAVHENHPGHGHALHAGAGERQGAYRVPTGDETAMTERGERKWLTAALSLGLPVAVTAAVVAALMYWHNGTVFPT